MKNWLCNLASEFVEGLADGFLILFGGASVAQFGAEAMPRIPPLQALCTVLLAGVWYVASFVKKNPPPFAGDLSRDAGRATDPGLAAASNREPVQTPGLQQQATVPPASESISP